MREKREKKEKKKKLEEAYCSVSLPPASPSDIEILAAECH
jgi:hypothetical protein